MSETKEYSVWNTPLSRLVRGKIGPRNPRLRLDPLSPVGESDLPAQAKDLITRVVRKTRLWKSEKQEIAEDLLSHFADGLDAGRPLDDLLASFGHPAKAAKLMRRAKKRNRPIWWQFLHRSRQFAAAVVLLYLGLFAWAGLSHPSPSIDYSVSLNRIAFTTPESQHAWPLYRKALIQYDFAKLDPAPLYHDSRQSEPVRPEDPEWPAAAAFLDAQQPLLAAIREAAAKPHLGLIVGRQDQFSPEDARALGLPPAPNTGRPPEGRSWELVRDSVSAILLPHLSKMRAMSELLAADMRYAAVQKDASRVAADYRAILGIARQTQDPPISASYFVALGVIALGDGCLSQITATDPDLLEHQRIELLHTMASANDLFRPTLSFGRDYGYDLIQRVYTDSGDGNGHFTMDGLQVVHMMTVIVGTKRPETTASALLLAPVSGAVVASRRELTETFDRYWSAVEKDLSRPVWEQLRSPAASEQYLKSLRSSPSGQMRYLPLTALSPSGSVGRPAACAQGYHEALTTALALEAYRQKKNKYPESLHLLVPQFMPQPPLDYSTGQPLLYRLENGKPLLYGRGMDDKDDGGTRPKDANKSPIPETGDWILYPPPTD